jgi:hypothetical protein
MCSISSLANFNKITFVCWFDRQYYCLRKMRLNASLIIFGLNHYYYLLSIFIIFISIEFEFLHFMFFYI